VPITVSIRTVEVNGVALGVDVSGGVAGAGGLNGAGTHARAEMSAGTFRTSVDDSEPSDRMTPSCAGGFAPGIEPWRENATHLPSEDHAGERQIVFTQFVNWASPPDASLRKMFEVRRCGTFSCANPTNARVSPSGDHAGE
jgi:hypothetical protein